MNQEQNNLNPNNFNTQGNNGIPNNQPLNNQSFNNTFNQNIVQNPNVNQSTFNQHPINSQPQPQPMPSFQQPINQMNIEQPAPQPMNTTFESGNPSNQSFNSKPPKKMNLWLIIGIIAAVVVAIVVILMLLNRDNGDKLSILLFMCMNSIWHILSAISSDICCKRKLTNLSSFFKSSSGLLDSHSNALHNKKSIPYESSYKNTSSGYCSIFNSSQFLYTSCFQSLFRLKKSSILFVCIYQPTAFSWLGNLKVDGEWFVFLNL